MEIPVYLFAGFLDSGKTSFLNDILADGFARETPTLLLCCEEGEEEYDPKVLDNVTVVTVDSQEELKCSLLKELERQYQPQQVLIEYNGMWPLPWLEQEVLPSNWILYQVMTTVDAATFDVYAKNMGQIMMEKLLSADMILFNRCTPELRDALRRRNLRMVNRRADIFLENTDGTSEPYLTGDECPFDLSQSVIDIPDDDFGIFYVDAMEHPERYAGKDVHLKLVMCHVPQYPDVAIPGRFAMVCCENDVTFLGLVATGKGLDQFPNRAWVEVTARVGVGHHPAYGRDQGPILAVTAIAPCRKAQQEVISF